VREANVRQSGAKWSKVGVRQKQKKRGERKREGERRRSRGQRRGRCSAREEEQQRREPRSPRSGGSGPELSFGSGGGARSASQVCSSPGGIRACRGQAAECHEHREEPTAARGKSARYWGGAKRELVRTARRKRTEGKHGKRWPWGLVILPRDFFL